VFPFSDGNARVNFRLKTKETFHYLAQYRKLNYCNNNHQFLDYEDNRNNEYNYDKFSEKLKSTDVSCKSSSTPSSTPSSLATRTEYWLTCVYVEQIQ